MARKASRIRQRIGIAISGGMVVNPDLNVTSGGIPNAIVGAGVF